MCVAWGETRIYSIVQMQNICSPITNNTRHNLATGYAYMITRWCTEGN